MLFLPPKFLFLLLLATFTDAQSSNHTNFDSNENISSLQKRNRYVRDEFNCAELSDSKHKSKDVIKKKCIMLRAEDGYTLHVEDDDGPAWDSFANNLRTLSKITLNVDDSTIFNLTLDNLDRINGFRDIIINENKDLVEISFNLTDRMDIGNLTITNNAKLKTIKISPANAFQCTGSVNISKNPELESVEFIGTSNYDCRLMEIRQNDKLTTFANFTYLNSTKLIIKGNRCLNEEDLETMRQISKQIPKWDIQEHGDCIFDKPITELSQLDFCVRVNQLKLAKGATGEVQRAKLRNVDNGDVELADVPYNKLLFLELVRNIKTISTDLCEFPDRIEPYQVNKPLGCFTTTGSSIDVSPPSSGGSSGSGGSSNSSSVSSASQASPLSNMLPIIAGAVVGGIVLAVVISIITACICYKKKKKPGQSFYSWLCCHKVKKPPPVKPAAIKAKTTSTEKTNDVKAFDFSKYIIGTEDGIVIYRQFPNDRETRRKPIPEHDYYMTDTIRYRVRWKGDFKEDEYDENLMNEAKITDCKKLTKIQSDFEANMRRFNGCYDGDMMESYFYQKNLKEIQKLAKTEGKSEEDILNYMVIKRIKEKITQYYEYLTKNKLVRAFPQPSKHVLHGQAQDGDDESNEESESTEKVESSEDKKDEEEKKGNDDDEGKKRDGEEEKRKDGGKEMTEKSAEAPEAQPKREIKKPTDEENKILDDLIMVMMLPNYCRLVEYDEPMKHVILRIVDLALDVMIKLPRLEEVPAPCVILGDIHGQYRDLVRVFRMFNENKRHGIFNQRYLFMGDYVDRGYYSLEVILLLYLLKIRHPMRFYLLRGNHELKEQNTSRNNINEFFTIVKNQLKNTGFWDEISDIYGYLPLAGLIGGRILCMHAGISKHLKSLNDIRAIPVPLEDTDNCKLAEDMIWSDPCAKQELSYVENGKRGKGIFWNPRAAGKTCTRLGIDLIVRAHQVPENGFQFTDRTGNAVTVFTAPNYEKFSRNDGAILIVKSDGKLEFRKYGSEKYEMTRPS